MSSWRNDTWHSLILKYVRFSIVFASLRNWHVECIFCGEDKNEAVKARESKTGCASRFGKEKEYGKSLRN